MANNPLLFPTQFAPQLRLADTKLSDSRSASTSQLKQLILRMFYGSSDPQADVPTFYFESDRFSWTNGYALFNNTIIDMASGSYVFSSSDNGMRYVYAVNDGSIAVSSVPTDSANQQNWWTLFLSAGNIVDILPAKPGFGI